MSHPLCQVAVDDALPQIAAGVILFASFRLGIKPDFAEVGLVKTVSCGVLTGISHHRRDALFATCGENVHLWEHARSEPLRALNWGVDTVYAVRFNPIEVNVMASASSDRSIVLYDTRESQPLRRVFLEMRSNTVCWNPMEAFIFTCANEDYKWVDTVVNKKNAHSPEPK
ncbi:hypothetical protein HPB51_020405 [Rhipicephalus microplus]|uniref:Uncharacterized protein n=1 Tax=Rhipicephalus microplus TaxID=6941 RepID=A0A9J6DW73_RHIMP|nr:hypothetical protein HPB51_020405 [Rhipicephalus microplus]